MENQQLQQGIVVHRDTLNPDTTSHRMALFNEDGTPYSPGGRAGGGGGGLLGPFTIDRSVVGGEDLWSGVVLTTLAPGDLITDISWRIPTLFSGFTNPTGNYEPSIVYIGTEDVNFMLGPTGSGWDSDAPNSETQEATRFSVAYDDLYYEAGDWLLPAGNIDASLLSYCNNDGDQRAWYPGLWVPDTPNLDVLVKIKLFSSNYLDSPLEDDSTDGVVEFYIHTSRPS